MLLNADDQGCLNLLSRRPWLAASPCSHAGSAAHPLILLAQWPGRLPQHCDPGFAARAERIADALFENGADLSAPATAAAGPSCALALLSRMAELATIERAWGLPHPGQAVEPLIQRASLREGQPGRADHAKAWIQAALGAAGSGIEPPKGFCHFIGLARSEIERGALCEAAREDAPRGAGSLWL